MATPKKTVKKPAPKPKQHPLEPVVRELVDQVALIADAVKAKSLTISSDPDPILIDPLPPPDPSDPPIIVPPTDPILPPPPPPPAPTPCCDDCKDFCTFIKNKPAVSARPYWNPTKEGGAGWDWDPLT